MEGVYFEPIRQSSQYMHINFNIFQKLRVRGSDAAESFLLYHNDICYDPRNPFYRRSVFNFIGQCLYGAGFDDHEIDNVLNRASRDVIHTLNLSRGDVMSIGLNVCKTEILEDDDIVDEVEEDFRAVEAAMEEAAPKPIPATKESIDALKKVKLGDKEIDQVSVISQTCAVCLEELITQPETKELIIASMPCSHLFHEDCIVRWLNTSHLCPLCRFPMPT